MDIKFVIINNCFKLDINFFESLILFVIYIYNNTSMRD